METQKQTKAKAAYILVTADELGVANGENHQMDLSGVLQEIAKRGTPKNFLTEATVTGLARCTFLIQTHWLVIYGSIDSMSDLLYALECMYQKPSLDNKTQMN